MRVDVCKSSEITLQLRLSCRRIHVSGVFFLSFECLVTVYAFVYAAKIIFKRATFVSFPLALLLAILISQSR